MNIICVVRDFNEPFDEGSVVLLRELVRFLSKRHKVSVVGIGKRTEVKEICGVKSYLFWSPFFEKVYERFFYPFGFLNLLIKARKLLEEISPDAILCFQTPPPLGMLSFFLKLISPNRPKFIKFLLSSYYTPMKTPSFSWLIDHLPYCIMNNIFVFRLSLKMYDKIVSTSIWLDSAVKGMGYSSLYNPLGVDVERFSPNKGLRKEYRRGL